MSEDQKPAATQSTAGEPSVAEQTSNEGKALEFVQKRQQRAARKDKDRQHVMRHGMLSKYPLETLIGQGEDKRKLRRIERMFRAELQPLGMIGAVFFDRFWYCYLWCLLAGKSRVLSKPGEPTNNIPSITIGPTPVLTWSERGKTSDFNLQEALIHEMALVERYDRHVSREMYRTLAVLLFMRDHGTEDLAQVVGNIGK